MARLTTRGRWDGIADLVIEKRVSESLLAPFDLKRFLYISVGDKETDQYDWWIQEAG
jgi:hypothetical protein